VVEVAADAALQAGHYRHPLRFVRTGEASFGATAARTTRTADRRQRWRCDLATYGATHQPWCRLWCEIVGTEEEIRVWCGVSRTQIRG
jgi:hypothetical protein